MECSFFENDEVHDLISHSYLSDEDKKSKETMANASELMKSLNLLAWLWKPVMKFGWLLACT